MLRNLANFVHFLAVLRRFQGTPQGGESTSPPENDIKNRINKGRVIIAMLTNIMWNRQITRKKNKLQIYNSIVISTVTYGAETWK